MKVKKIKAEKRNLKKAIERQQSKLKKKKNNKKKKKRKKLRGNVINHHTNFCQYLALYLNTLRRY